MSATFVTGIEGLQGVIDRLAAQPGQVDRALKRAEATTANWAARQGGAAIARALRIAKDALAGRVRSYVHRADGNAKAWFGLAAVPSTRLHPHQTQSGAVADGFGVIPHSFVLGAQVRHGHRLAGTTPGIFRRVGAARYPLEFVELPIDQVGEEVIGSEIVPQVEAKLVAEFERELDKEILK